MFTNQPGDRRGREALALVAQHDFLQADDIAHDRAPLPLGPRPNAGYRAFISVAVFSGDQDFGMLTVDAPEPYAFDDTDLNVLRAWSTGRLRSSDYFARTRERALAKASDTVRGRLRRIASGDDDTQRAAW